MVPVSDERGVDVDRFRDLLYQKRIFNRLTFDSSGMVRQRRRAILRWLGIAGTGAVAGCSRLTSGTPDGDSETPTDTESPSPTESGSPSPTPASFTPSQQVKLTPSDGHAYDNFGDSVALSGDGSTALVGADRDKDSDGTRVGAAYAFERTDGEWTMQARLAAADGDEYDRFGVSVALSDDGSIALVGALEDEDPNGKEAGSAYVFERTGGDWSQQAKLAPSVGNENDYFGNAVALSGDGSTGLVGAVLDEEPNGKWGGSAYVFERTGSDWSQQAKLAATDGDEGDWFGNAVALSEDASTALVGAYSDEDPYGVRCGSAYVFERAGSGWAQQAKLTPVDGDEHDRFGRSVALSGDGLTALVGADKDEDPNGKSSGSGYVFERADGDWSQQAKLAATDGDEDDWFGLSVALASEGSTALVGAFFDEDPNGKEAGSAYVFERAGSDWSQQAKLVATDGDEGDTFGLSVALADDGSTALVGASDDEDPHAEDTGSAYVFW